jgi:predicted methyltransferase
MPPDRAFVGMERELKEIQKTFRTAYALIFRISMAMENSSTVVNETLLGVDTTLRNIHRNFSTVKDEVVEVLQKVIFNRLFKKKIFISTQHSSVPIASLQHHRSGHRKRPSVVPRSVHRAPDMADG